MSAPKFKRADLELLWERRWLARTDLLWLCHNILDFKDVTAKVHGPMIDHLQQFPVPSFELAREIDLIQDNGTFKYTPRDPYVACQGARKRVLLFSRSFYKTSVNTIAHSIQWLLNYPQAALCLLFSTDQKSQHVLKNSIKHHFQFNARMRELFPEYCPKIRISDFGSSESFTLPCREKVLERLGLPPRVEPSMMSQSLDKGQAGYHYDVIKCSDIVEENNVQTIMQREQVVNRFGLLPKLLVKRPDGSDGWVDLEGTFYDPDDLHSRMIRDWITEDEASKSHRWQIFINGCFERDTKGEPRKYDPSELKLPFLLDTKGKRVPTWPKADSIEKLEREEADPLEGGHIFAYQRILDIKADKSTNRPFKGIDGIQYMKNNWIDRSIFNHIPIAYRLTTVDLADTTGPKSNPSVITTCAYDTMGCCYVENIQRGKWGPDETINRLYDTWDKFKNKGLRQICIEEYNYVRGLKPSIERKAFIRKFMPEFYYFPANDRTPNGKLKRIIATLQGPFSSGAKGAKMPDLRFVSPLDLEDEDISRELAATVEREFFECTVVSTGSSDDILDTLAMQYMCREWFGKEILGTGVQDEKARIALREKEYGEAFHRMAFDQSEILSQVNASGW